MTIKISFNIESIFMITARKQADDPMGVVIIAFVRVNVAFIAFPIPENRFRRCLGTFKPKN